MQYKGNVNYRTQENQSSTGGYNVLTSMNTVGSDKTQALLQREMVDWEDILDCLLTASVATVNQSTFQNQNHVQN